MTSKPKRDLAMTRAISLALFAAVAVAMALLPAGSTQAGQKKQKKAAEEWKAPALPDGKSIVTDTSDAFLKPPAGLKEGVTIAKVAPTIEFVYFPGQTYAGKPWSAWGESTFANGKYYASIGDHLAPAGSGFVYEYDPAKREFRQ